MSIKRGDIFYIQKGWATTGSEQYAGRPGIIVSNNENNRHSDTVEIVYCTTKIKAGLPTHTTVWSTPYESTVLCEQVTTVSVDRLGDYIGRCTEDEMREIDQCVMTSLGLELPMVKEQIQTQEEPAPPKPAEKEENDNEMLALRIERDTYKRMYELSVDKFARLVEGIRNGGEKEIRHLLSV